MITASCGGSGSDASSPDGSPIDSIWYLIEFTNSPAETTVRVGEIAEASMSWQFTTSERHDLTPYLIRTTSTGVVINGDSGNAVPSVVLTYDLSYECETIESIEVELTVIVGNASSTVTWSVNCTGQLISVDPIDLEFSSVGVAVDTSMQWRYQSVGEDPQDLQYTVTSNDELLTIDPHEGTSLPGSDIHVGLTYLCERAGEVEVEITIAVGTANEPVLWEIVCTEESVVIETAPASVSVSIGEDADGEMTWHFQSTGEIPRDFYYSVTSVEIGITIVDGMGTSLPEASITQKLSYRCESEGRTEVGIEIEVGSVRYTIDWRVECTRESVLVEQNPTFSSVSVGEMARSEFKWQVMTTSEEPRSFDFLINSQNAALIVRAGEGRVETGEVITTNLEFRCVEAVTVTLPISVEVGSETYLLTWVFECTEEAIRFAVNPLPLNVKPVGEVASTELRWTLESTSVAQREFMYSVVADQPSVQIGNASGVTVAGVLVDHEITYTCDVGGQTNFMLSVKIGSKQADISWFVVCAQDSITITSSPSSARVPVGETTNSTISWTFESSYSDRRVSYRVESGTSAVQIDPNHGVISVGDVVQSNLSYSCTSRGSVALDIQILAGGASLRLTWDVLCSREDVSRFVSTFYQGPRISTVEFESNQGLWTYSLVPETRVSEVLRFRTNRQVFMAIRAEHDESPVLLASVWFEAGERRYTAVQVGETETQVNPVQSGARYSSEFLFEIPAHAFSTHGEIQVLFDPETHDPEMLERDHAIGFALDARNTAKLPSMNLTFVPIRTRSGVPNLSDVNRYTRPIYELMPVGEINVELASELDASDLSWSQDTGREILDRLYALYLTHSDRRTVYHGVVKQPQDQRVSLCGIAFVGVNVGITAEDTPECSDNTVAHEIGHNFNLQHAPACGAESENPDPAFPYLAGNIGRESGWLMKQRLFVDGTERDRSSNRNYRFYDVMSYCPETFTSRYSYGRAFDNVRRKAGVQAASPVEDPLLQEFGWIRDRSIVVIGTASKNRIWQIRNVALSDQYPHQFHPESSGYLVQLIHTTSGTVLHQEATRPISTAHGEDGEESWGVRMPFFDSDDLQLIVVDGLNNVVLDYDLTATLNQLVH